MFAFSLFGYMLFLIFYKWSIDWNNGTDGMTGPLGGIPGTGKFLKMICFWTVVSTNQNILIYMSHS